MIVDFHTHIFPPEIREHRDRYFPDEPAFRLLYDSPKSRLVGAKEMVAAMDQSGVDISVVFGFPWRGANTCKRNNDYVLEAVARYPKRLVGFACVDPADPQAAAEVARCLESGLAGVGELAFYQSGIAPEALDHLAPIMEICQSRSLPVLIHTNEPVGHNYPGKTPNTLDQIYRLVERFPANLIVLAHWGGGIFFFNLLRKEVKERFQNVYFDTAASPFLYEPQVYRMAAEIIGAHKILLGSDFPLLPASRYFQELADSGLSEAGIARIRGLNAQSLLKL